MNTLLSGDRALIRVLSQGDDVHVYVFEADTHICRFFCVDRTLRETARSAHVTALLVILHTSS